MKKYLSKPLQIGKCNQKKSFFITKFKFYRLICGVNQLTVPLNQKNTY